MAVRIQFRRGTSTEWSSANPVLASGELGYESNTKVIKFGDGSTQWTSLPVAAAGDIMSVKAGTGLRYSTSYTTDITGNSIPGAPVGGESGNVVLEIDPSVVLSSSVMDAKGDLIVGTGADTYAIFPVGTVNGQSLTVNSASSTGLSWATPTDPVISAGYITDTMLAVDAVQESNIRGSATVDANRSITTDKIRDGAITAAKMAANAVTTASILDSQVTEGKLSGDGTTDGTRAVTTNKIRNLAVTRDKIAANAVDSSKIDGTVYQRSTTGFTASSAKIFINSSATAPTGSAGDIWFKY